MISWKEDANEGEHHSLGAAVAKTYPVDRFDAGAKQFGQSDFGLGGHGEATTVAGRPGGCVNDLRPCVAMDQRGEIVHHVEPAGAVDIYDDGAFAAPGIDRERFDQGLKARDAAGQHRPGAFVEFGGARIAVRPRCADTHARPPRKAETKALRVTDRRIDFDVWMEVGFVTAHLVMVTAGSDRAAAPELG